MDIHGIFTYILLICMANGRQIYESHGSFAQGNPNTKKRGSKVVIQELLSRHWAALAPQLGFGPKDLRVTCPWLCSIRGSPGGSGKIVENGHEIYGSLVVLFEEVGDSTFSWVCLRLWCLEAEENFLSLHLTSMRYLNSDCLLIPELQAVS